MELLEDIDDTVHPEVRAHITSLASALGGTSSDGDGDYQLGDDALEVLRDIKRWIRFYDDKTNRMDVARCIRDVNLVQGDLLPILAKWPGEQLDSAYKTRIVLACFELMVPLTWPLDWDKERMTVNHHRHMPVLELAQVEYKKAIINFDGARILHMAVRTALPAMEVSLGDRSSRDQAMIKLVLFLLRNLAMISPRRETKYQGDESQISRSAIIDAFSYQDIFDFLLMLASNMGDDFGSEDMTVMEIIYHVVKRVDVQRLFLDETQRRQAEIGELSAIIRKESAMVKGQGRRGGSRHNRFGTMIWMSRGDGKVSTLSGQDALCSAADRYKKLDSGKTFKPPRRGKKDDKVTREMGQPTKLELRATTQLRSFVHELLDSGFNPLFQQARRSIDREAPHVLQSHRRQFFYLVAWFLEAEQARRRIARDRRDDSDASDVTSFNLVAGVLNQEMFIMLNKALHEAFDNKDWHELSAVMRCFTRIMLTVQEMAESPNDQDQEIAENVLSRIFYEEATHQLIVNVVKTYKDQGFDYLDAATELVHHFVRILEAYSKQNVDMQIRSRRRARRTKAKAARDAGPDAGPDNGPEHDDKSGSEHDEAEAQRVSKDRKFDFHRFASRLSAQPVVDGFVAFTKYYGDLDEAQLKRAHRYFYRLAFKQDMCVMLLRVDIIHLLYNMIKGPQPLDKALPSFKEWEELVKHLLRKCFNKLEQRPQLLVEMLFSKLPKTAFFLEFGYEKQTIASARALKPAAELQFKFTEERDRQIAIVVGAMLDRNESEHIDWLKQILGDAETERRLWAPPEAPLAPEPLAPEPLAHEPLVPEPLVPEPLAPEPSDPQPEASGHDDAASEPPVIIVRPDTPARRTAMFKNSYLRLLMTISGLRRLAPASDETPESLWVVASDVSPDYIKDSLHFIAQAEFSPPTFDEGVLAAHQLRRKPAPRKKPTQDANDQDDDMADFLFPDGGPTTRKAIDDADEPKKPGRRRRRRRALDESDDQVSDQRAAKRRERELEKARRIKSALYVRQGDDEFDQDEDEAFFARERAIADRARKAAESVPAALDATPSSRLKRKSDVLLTISSSDDDDDDDDGDDDDDDDGGHDNNGSRNHDHDELSDQSATQSEAEDGRSHASSKRRKSSPKDHDSHTHDASDDEASNQNEDLDSPIPSSGVQSEAAAPEPQNEPAAISKRARIRGGFVIDSDDDD
ncbi:hypothetical protein CDD82_6478 [Ophiocordyceps australis]|uniref:Topoisomerase 1-associated factor 1 n=1 Tax=Ophiocordyceps australis TaxID=1399860 RepID=A0A2C5YV51_9HYPO|nr:hypothetical protein CDD82_6478 [Ophiocordyceps australis]